MIDPRSRTISPVVIDRTQELLKELIGHHCLDRWSLDKHHEAWMLDWPATFGRGPLNVESPGRVFVAVAMVDGFIHHLTQKLNLVARGVVLCGGFHGLFFCCSTVRLVLSPLTCVGPFNN